MRRRVRPPATQLARAGERTLILKADTPVPSVRFRASVLDGTPEGRIEIDRGAGPETRTLASENEVDGADLVAISVIPAADTAISFLPVNRPGNPALVLAGAVLVIGAVLWTAFDLFPGG